MLSGPQVCRQLGITYRQLDYWCRTGVVRPQGEGRGSGTRRRFAEGEVRALGLAKSLMALGATTQLVAGLAARWQDQPLEEWRGWLVVHADGSAGVDQPVEGAAWVVDLEAIAGTRRQLVAV